MTGEFEQALANTESDATAAQRAAEQVVKATKRMAAAARVGDVPAIERAITESQQALQALEAQINTAERGWTFDLPTYAELGLLTEELVQAAHESGLRLYEQDGRIFSYPLLVRVVAGKTAADTAVLLDRKRTKALRPSHLAAQLKLARDRPPKFNSRDFLKSLYEAYCQREREWASGKSAAARGPVVELVRLYDLLTLFPGQRRDYTKQEFARDMYLLDRSGTRDVADGSRIATMELSASTGTKGSRSRLLQIIDEEGQDIVYYAICFVRQAQS